MTNAYRTIRLVIADDHEVVREGLLVLLKKIEGIEIVGEAANGEELIRLANTLKPDVILTDVKMPKLNGIEVTKKIKEQWPHIGIVALSSFEEQSLVLDMLKAGAKGYLLKNASKQEFSEAIRAAYADEPFYSKQIQQKLAETISKGGFIQEDRKKSDVFTERELQVIDLICEGQSSKQVASALNIKTRTVERYRDSIMEKMGINNAAALVHFAMTNGIYRTFREKE
jgi:DNA-binding NarL/FixJ family response regulator